MHKSVPCFFIFALFLVACISGCSSSGSSSTAPVVDYKAPAVFASYTATQIGGAVQGGAIPISSKFSNYSISTLAGTAAIGGFKNYTGNGSTKAQFNQPLDITFDANGKNFYVADTANNAIRKITPNGQVTTLNCTLLDGITPIGFNRPSGITNDGTNLYVADTGSNTIRVIEIAQTIRILNFPPYTSPTTSFPNRVTAIIGSPFGLAGSVDSKEKNAALFNQPTGITTDGKNLYVADFNNATVRWIDLSDYAVYTLAGISGSPGSDDGSQEVARFNRPGYITTDGKNLYLTDFYNRTIRQIEIKSGKVTTIAGKPGQLESNNGTLDGIGTEARFNQPNGITTDGVNLYVTDAFLKTIRKIVLATWAVSTIQIPDGSLLSPGGITTDGKSLFVVDTFFLNDDKSTTYSNSIIRVK